MERFVNLSDVAPDERLRAMESAIAQLSAKPLFFAYDPTIAEDVNGHQKEYADCIVVTFAVDGPSQEYVIAHELAHTLRNQMHGSLQLDPASFEFPDRRQAKHIASMLEHPSVIRLVREYGFQPDAILARPQNHSRSSRGCGFHVW